MQGQDIIIFLISVKDLMLIKLWLIKLIKAYKIKNKLYKCNLLKILKQKKIMMLSITSLDRIYILGNYFF